MSCDNTYFVNEPTFRGTGGGATITLSNVGGGTELVNALSSGNYPIKTLIAGTGMSFTVGADTITFNSKTLDGTAIGNTLRWNGTNWVESTGFRNFNNYFGINTVGNSYSALTISDSAIPGGIIGLDIDSHNPIGMRVTMNKASDSNAVGIGITQGTASYTGLMLQLANTTSNIFSINHLGKIVSLDLKTTTAHPAGYHSLYVDSSTGLVYSQAAATGSITGASNVGTGDGWWKDESSGTLRFKSLTTDSSINVVSNADDLNLSVANPLPTGLSEETLRHNGTNWVANSLIRNNGTNIRLNGALNSTRVLTVTDSGSTCFVPVKITGTKTTALEVEITTGSLSGAKAIDIQSTNASFNGNYISVQNTTTGLKFKVDSEGAVTSDYLTSSVAHPGSFFGVFVDATTGKMYANTAGSGAAGGALPAGTGTGNVLYWNGSAWVETADFIIAGVGAELVNNHALTLRGNVSGGTAVSIYATPVGSAYNLFLPANQGTAGTVLVNDGSGNLDWKALPKNLVTEVDDNIIPSLVVGLAEVAKTYTLTGVTTANPACDASIVGLGAQAGQFTVRAEVTAVDTITVYYSYNDGLGGTIDIGDKFIHVENKIY